MSLLRTSLFEEHQKLNAKFSPFAGYEMPLQYSSVKEEALAVRKSVGVFDVSHMAEFLVEGNQATEFIDFLITNDFRNAPIGKAVYSPICNDMGKVLDDLIVYKLSNQKVLICSNAANHKKDWDWISSKVGGYDCSISDHSDETSLLAIQGPDSENIMHNIGFEGLSGLPYYAVLETSIENQSVIIARTGYTGEDGFEIFASHDLIKSLWKKFMAKGVAPCGLASRDVLRLEVAYPLYGNELNEELGPLDSGLKWTVKLDKENFIGKNAILESKPTHRLVRLSLEKGIPRPGYLITNDKGDELGKVTSGTHSVSLAKGIGMGLVQKDLFPENKKFFINIRGKLVEANYHAKAFLLGSHK